jgi:hypothetical protein
MQPPVAGRGVAHGQTPDASSRQARKPYTARLLAFVVTLLDVAMLATSAIVL